MHKIGPIKSFWFIYLFIYLTLILFYWLEVENERDK